MKAVSDKEKKIKEIKDRISRNKINLMLSDLISDVDMYTEMIEKDSDLLHKYETYEKI